MSEPKDTNEAACGGSALTDGLAAPTCAIGGVFEFPGGGMAACTQHGGENRCFDNEPCEHKVFALVCPRCKVDRLKAPCPDNSLNCPMRAAAANARNERPAEAGRSIKELEGGHR